MLNDDDIVLLKVAHRIGPGEMKKIIDDACAKPGRDPLEEYYLFVVQLNRLVESEKYRQESIMKKEKRKRRPWKERWGRSAMKSRWRKRSR